MTPPDVTASAPTAEGEPPPVDDALREILRTALRQVGAAHGAVGVLAPDGRRIDRFVTAERGDDLERVGRLPTEPGVLAVPLRGRDAVVGQVYLSRKPGDAPFTAADAEAVRPLAAVAALAVEADRATRRAGLRRTWMQAGTESATALLRGADTSAVLRDVAAQVAGLLDADLTGVLLPVPDDTSLTIAAASGPDAADLEGVRVPVANTHVGRVHRSGVAAVIGDVGADPVLGAHAEVAVEITRPYGPGLIAPLGSAPSQGIVIAMRAAGREPFDAALLEPVTAFGAQTAAALALARRQARERRLQVQADRDRIARDLHDHVVQRIFATALSLDRLSRSLEAEHAEAAERLSRSVDELDGTIAEIRAAIFELHERDRIPPATLRAQLVDVVRQVTEGRPLRRDVRVRGAVEELPPELVPDLVAVVRELVTNVVRHAAASRVTVTVHAEEEVRVVVSDDGVGLRPGIARSGLANLADRAERRGGRLSTASRPAGTQVRWVVPRR